ncbi:MAG: hypothetical protein GXY58_07600 [Planctomycetaceae bacterium]|nr:hypothetical protein [Planctomycetaceae bacterium]
MIVPMCKVYLVGRRRDRERLMETIRDAGVMHLVPADPERAAADEPTQDHRRVLQRALQVLRDVTPRSAHPEVALELTPLEAAHRVLEIEQRNVEHLNRLAALDHQLAQLNLWGDLELHQFETLRASGVEVRFYAVPKREVVAIEAACTAVVGSLPDGQSLVAVATRVPAGAADAAPPSPAGLPASAVPVPLPQRDAPSIRTEAAEIDAALQADSATLGALAQRADAMQEEWERLERQAAFHAALRGGLERDQLFAVVGWSPADVAPTLVDRLAEAGLPGAVQFLEPTDDDQPPTLIRRPAWAQPIEGLLKVLGTVAGYREFDVSIPFLIAVPIFTAILIGDGGYGAVMLLALTVGYRRAVGMLGKHFTQLLLIVAGATLAWGLTCATFFGVTLYPPLIAVDLSEQSREFMMRLCFVMGAIHLSIAQLWGAAGLFPDLRFLSKVGWSIFIWGMLGVVQMFVLKTALNWSTPWPYLLLVGAALAIVFHQPSRNPVKMLGWGLANFPLSMLSAFSDVISYVRLMAVGLASGVLATNFNEMASGIEPWPLAALVLVFGHSLNMGLAMIAMFAHGVRLNMLEFCNHLGMQWTGYAYSPFSK